MSWQDKALWLEKITKRMMLIVGALGVVVIYGGFFFLLFSGRSVAVIPWFFFTFALDLYLLWPDARTTG